MRNDIIQAYRTIRLSRSSELPGCALVTEMTVSSALSRRRDIYPPHQDHGTPRQRQRRTDHATKENGDE